MTQSSAGLNGFLLSDEHLLVRRAVLDAMESLRPNREKFVQAILKDRVVPPEVWDTTVELGLTGAMIPEEYGGNGMGLLALTLGFEEMCAQGYGNVYVVLDAMDSACIVRNGSEELKKRYLPDVAAGRTKLCFGLTEPNAGSNTARLETTAKADGDEYVIRGEKVFITGADEAEHMLVVTRTLSQEEARESGLGRFYGISLFMVPTDAPGFNRSEIPTRGIEGARQFAIHFDEVRVPKENMVGDEHMGAMALFNSLNPERVLAGAVAVGATRYLLERACDYARERKVFSDTPIGAHQAIAHPLAEIRIEMEAAQLLTYRAAWAFDQGLPPQEVGQAANMSKYLAAELGVKAADRAIQTLGGYGWSEEYGVIYFWETLRLLRTAPITKEMILNYVAEHTLDLPRSY